MIDPEIVWRLEFKKLPPAPVAIQGVINLANYIQARITTLSLSNIGPAPITMIWGKAAFIPPLSVLPPSVDPITPRTMLANAWQASILASTFVVPAGAVIPQCVPPVATECVPLPNTGIFGIPGVVVVEPASLAAAYSTLLSELIAMPLAETAEGSKMPVHLRNAFMSLKYMVTAIDTTPPPAGPLPISVVVGVI